jgi:predicted RNA binding protein YcfA (HicA-like mRNA interferase family)
MDDIYECCVREVGLANGNRMTRTEINKVCYRLKQLERKIDNLALMIVDISNEILEQTEQSMVNNTQALLNYNGGKYWQEILDAISELQQERCDGIKEKRMLRITSRKELEELVSGNGFEFKRQSGSHRIYANEDGNITIIPQHGKTVSSGVGYAVQKQINK